jgi:hypothetical protein
MPLNKSPDYKIGTKAGRTNKLDLYQQRLLETDTSRNDFTDDQLNDYSEIYNSTPLWHGSGRYQYDDTGAVKDVFACILEQGGFTPKFDTYDLSTNMTSISLTPDRAYARMYADIHHPDPDNAPRHGSPDLLTGYYVGPVPVEALKETVKTFGLLESVKAIQRVQASVKEDGRWSKKVNKNTPSITHIFREGSDIEGNYPILFGIADIEEKLPVSDYIAKHEVRTTTKIDLSKVTHLEVPEKNVVETRDLLAQYGIDMPVVPIELGEAYSASMQRSRETSAV